MSEDVGVKAPVTRLRRRLSVESEDVKSPAGTTTPTKKKGGRLATKPQLDLIEEIDAEPIPKRSTRKTATKDTIESVEEKPMTPSRRSARIRSNTSILSETPQTLDSPRAKRAAARRTSQAGSDNDAPLTPARQTRRTRKDSTSSIDKQVDKASTKTPATTEVIVEEKENNDDESNTKDKSINKNPKPKENSGRNSISKSPDVIEHKIELKNEKGFNMSANKANQEANEESTDSVPNEVSLPDKTEKKNDNPEEKHSVKGNESKVNSSDILMDNLEAIPKKSNSILHKSTSAIEDSKSFKNKRHRTKSVSSLATNEVNDCNFLSDTEISKKKRRDKSLTLHSSNISSKDNEVSSKSKDNSLNPAHIEDDNSMNQNTIIKSKKHRQSVDNEKNELQNTSGHSSMNEASNIVNEDANHNSAPKTGWKKNIINQIETGKHTDSNEKNNYISPIKCFENAPSKNIQSVVFIEEDSDSNACNNDIASPVPHLDSEDQCVPVVKHDNNGKNSCDNSYEPMDIDESIQQNTSINISIKNTPKTPNQETKKESLMSIDVGTNCNNISSNKSKRKSSLSSFESHNEKSLGESKSTLLISQIKDTSSTEIDEISQKANNKEQLSKSVNIPDKYKNKEAERRKLSLDYSTSTPLQQKSIKKLGVPMDTSLISPKNGKSQIQDEDGQEIKKNTSNSKKQSYIESDENSEQSEESEEVTKTQNEFIDDEADEASEDYQSGDSQDEDERQYEEENKIVEKGETLDTEEEFSDDTDYEKDSFVVSSDEEDNDLLSGSGDDLSMSDNELSMSAKSKTKYNEKKIKEQKKASREMYEARHKLDNSDKTTTKSKSKKNNRQRLDSSDSDTEDVTNIQPKKNNRQRIDSSQDRDDVKLVENESITKKKKQKCLSESLSDDNVLIEQEITISNNSKLEDKDPISVIIKHEPRTPQKDHNLSAVVISEDIEEMNVDQNASIMKQNATSDPLQVTMHEADEDSSSSEDNVEIINNYNSVLENLNNNKKEIKKHDMSLNVNKKQKKTKEPIVEQLNLTQTKPKKNKKKALNTEEELSAKTKTQEIEEDNKALTDNEDDEGSDSINMRLLFTEDSNDSESATTEKGKDVSVINTSKKTDYIPLKKTEAKTNLLEDMDTPIESVQILNESKKKNKKQRPSQIISEESGPSGETDDNEASFFIDTVGTREDAEESMSTSLNSSSKKKKKRTSEIGNDVIDVKESAVNVEVGGKKTPKKSIDYHMDIEIISSDETADVSTKATPQSGKKKKKGKKSLNVTEVEEIDIQSEIVTDKADDNDSFFIDTTGTRVETEEPMTTLTNNSTKKKKRSSECDSNVVAINQSIVAEDNIGGKKTPKKSIVSELDVEIIPTEGADVSTNDTPQSGKKKKKGKKSSNVTEVEEIENETVHDEPTVPPKTQQSGKKKNKSLLSIDDSENAHITQGKEDTKQDKSFETTPASDKKNKKAKKSLTDIENVSQIDIPTETAEQSGKKGKSSQSNIEAIDIIPLELNNSDDDGPPLEIFRRDEKDNSGLDPQQTSEDPMVNEKSLNTSKNSAKKRKRKHSATNDGNISLGDIKEKSKDEQLNESLAGSQKKKRKLNNNMEELSTQDNGSAKENDETANVETRGQKLKKNKQANTNTDEHIQVINNEDTEKSKRNKKRKERDEDDTPNASKMFKQNVIDKAQVTRLPSYILNQLGDKPNKTVSAAKRAKVIATTKFTVEDAKVKRNKPSNYLEESVYLNDDSLVEKQQKYSIKKPKVLPFIPTASTSDSGFTTNFRINVLPRETQFVAKATNVINFKKDFLQQQKMKKFHTFEKYKTQRNVKLSKF